MTRAASLLVFVAIVPAVVRAQEPPRFSVLRFEDDYSYLDAPNAPSTPSDRLKRIPLFVPDSYVSFGGEVRLRYDYRHNPEWGQAPQDKRGAFLQRYLLHANAELGPHVRLFGEVRSALENGRAGPSSPVEEGQLDIQQGFLEIRGRLHTKPTFLSARIGRQEVLFGSQRLVSIREGPNVRRRFDGVRADIEGERFKATAIAAFPVRDEEGYFADDTNEDVALWGLYTTHRTPLGVPTDVDAYYLGAHADDSVYVQGQARELRHSVGVRLFGGYHGLDWNWEGIVQWGRFGRGDILAWTLATETGYRLETLPLSPRFYLSANIASGDEDPDDPDLETLNPLFPRGNYFSHLALLGPRNFFNVHPGVELRILESLVVGADANFFWRLETTDGLYGPSGNILRAGTGSEERYVGWATSASIGWSPNRFVFLGLVYTHGFAGPFIEATGPSKDIDFVELTFRLQF